MSEVGAPLAGPCLRATHSGPGRFLEQQLLQKQIHIEAWFRKQWQLTPPPLTCSVDLRNAGFKIAPIDTNLFPAGFNNLNREFLPLYIQAAQSALENACSSAVSILLISENHTRNLFYYESLSTLQEILLKAGFEVRVGSLLEDLTAPRQIDLPSGRQILLEPLIRQDDKVMVGDYCPCLILLNNDLSSGIPEQLKNIKQAIHPPLDLGWFKRLKSQHFAHYKNVAQEFAQLIDIDPWLIDPYFRQCDEVNFMKGEGETCLQENAQSLLEDITRKYREYNIEQKPFVVIKADSGTYGMGIMMIEDVAEISQLNRKERTRMSASKGHNPVNKVILQEGVYTFETWGQEAASAEPVVYMIGHHVLGGFYRIHSERSNKENLNAPGMKFEPLAFKHCCNDPHQNLAPDAEINRFYSYGVIARLALAAAAREWKDVKHAT